MPQKLAASPNKARSGNGNEPADTSNKSEMLVIVSIESEGPASGGVPRIHLGGESRRADDANGPRDQADVLKGQADELEGRTDKSRAQADVSNTSNEAKTVVVSHRTGAGTYLSTGDAKRAVDETDGIGSHADASSGHRDALNASNGAVMGSMSCRDSAEMYLGAADAKCAVDETECARGHADTSTGHRDTPSVEMDALNTSNNAGTGGISHGDEPNTYLGAGGAKRGVDATDGTESHTDTSSGHGDAQSIQTDAITTVNVPEIVSTHPIEPKRPNSPVGDAKRDIDETDGLGGHVDASDGQADAPSVDMDAIRPANASKTISIRQIEPKSPNLPAGSATSRSDATDGFGSHTDTSSVCTDVQCAGNDTQTATNEAEIVRTRQNSSKTRNSPHGREIATPEPTIRWKRVSVNGTNVYLPQNALIDTASRNFVFGRIEGGDEEMVVRVVDEVTGDGDGRWNGGDGSVDGTTSGNSIDST